MMTNADPGRNRPDVDRVAVSMGQRVPGSTAREGLVSQDWGRRSDPTLVCSAPTNLFPEPLVHRADSVEPRSFV
jgi:hypothetical protein